MELTGIMRVEERKMKKNEEKEKEEWSDKTKQRIAVGVTVFAILIAAFFYFGNKINSPEGAAKRFVKDYNNKRWSKIYPCYHFKEDTLINEKAYKKTMDQSEIKTLSQPEDYGKQAGQYVYQTQKGNDTIFIYITKSAQKYLLFFDKYEVTSVTDTGTTITTVKLFTMPGVTIKVDGITTKAPEGISGTTYYTRMFSGKHEITFERVKEPADQKSYTFNTADKDPLEKIRKNKGETQK